MSLRLLCKTFHCFPLLWPGSWRTLPRRRRWAVSRGWVRLIALTTGLRCVILLAKEHTYKALAADARKGAKPGSNKRKATEIPPDAAGGDAEEAGDGETVEPAETVTPAAKAKAKAKGKSKAKAKAKNKGKN